MKTTAVIAEYNPFHKGHEYHLREARRITRADFLLVVMSGNFVQRGEPALMDKYLRAGAALACGADLVLELPVCFCCASAEFFAEGAVRLLNDLGCVDNLCFGSECGDLSALSEIAQILSREPGEYRLALQDALKTGLSFPKAREQALLRALPPGTELRVPDTPNDILGIEYLKAMKKTDSPITPSVVKRAGDYHGTDTRAGYASAFALRSLLNPSAQKDGLPEDLPEEFIRAVPTRTRPVLRREYGRSYPVFANDFSFALQYRLMSARGWEDFARCFDVSEDLARRIFASRYQFLDTDSFVDLICARNLTASHVRRALLHILLDIPKDLPAARRSYYARVLGLRPCAQPLLREIKKNGRLPLISKPADAHAVLSSFDKFSASDRQDAVSFFDADMHFSEIYQTALTAKFCVPAVSECTRSVLI